MTDAHAWCEEVSEGTQRQRTNKSGRSHGRAYLCYVASIDSQGEPTSDLNPGVCTRHRIGVRQGIEEERDQFWAIGLGGRNVEVGR